MDELITKRQLDARVAQLLGKKTRDISVITKMFIDEARAVLVRSSHVYLDGLGGLHMKAWSGVRLSHPRLGEQKMVPVAAKYYVTFRRSCTLRQDINKKYRRKTMEKYGVDENVGEDLEKKAAAGCPVCGKKPVRQGNVLLCPDHGSEPFETKK
jgi:nucleoid DNA-binding protein